VVRPTLAKEDCASGEERPQVASASESLARFIDFAGSLWHSLVLFGRTILRTISRPSREVARLLLLTLYECTASKIIMFTNSLPNFSARFDDFPGLYDRVVPPLLAACLRALTTHQLADPASIVALPPIPSSQIARSSSSIYSPSVRRSVYCFDTYSYRKDRISLGSVDEGHAARNFPNRRRPVIGSEGHPDISYARGCRLHTFSEDAAARSGHDADDGERALMAGIKSEWVSGDERRCRATDRLKGYSSASLCDIGSRERVGAIVQQLGQNSAAKIRRYYNKRLDEDARQNRPSDKCHAPGVALLEGPAGYRHISVDVFPASEFAVVSIPCAGRFARAFS
ncbi:hypothetical protein THAOC_25544, partial [Thalassiosira oceanica]